MLLQQREKAPVAPAVAPSYQTLGVMLPYTPLHYLLLSAFQAARADDDPAALVMSSGNLSDEPIAYRDDEAQERLSPLVDGMLTHNRAIHMRCDDSVMRIASGGGQFFRRSRGTLIHHYTIDEQGLIRSANLIIATGHNNLAMNRGVLQVAQHFIKDAHITEGTLNRLEAVIRAFDPCLSCSTHALGDMPLHVQVLAADGAVVDERLR